eukprot:TRINITY_DN20297_c0_g1_i1.p1 TRINITY_DN20297_c0_g1~~TRINITY_DN20297_c0_g1_i1.p1  ORF type:complete len:503 (+),score=87.24 TRINITY_DN20297_c0_g1_i1:200-1510(+)
MVGEVPELELNGTINTIASNATTSTLRSCISSVVQLDDSLQKSTLRSRPANVDTDLSLSHTHLTATTTILSPPATYNHWKRGSQIGRGAFGAVYECVDLNGNVLAAKVLEFCERPPELTSYKEEIDTLRRLNHPNLIKYYGCTEDKNTLHIIMELAPGGSLNQLVERFGRLSVQHIRNYTKQILRGLEYLHGSGIVHRDIKSANVLIGKRGVVKLADFGVGKAVEDAMAWSKSGRNNHYIGSPAWLSPEVIEQPDIPPPQKSDIWGLGCCIIEMLGSTPWKGVPVSTPFSLLHHIVACSEAPSGVPDDVDPGINSLLKQTFQRKLSLRPSATSLLLHPFFDSSSDLVLSQALLSSTLPSPIDEEVERKYGRPMSGLNNDAHSDGTETTHASSFSGSSQSLNDVSTDEDEPEEELSVSLRKQLSPPECLISWTMPSS